MMLRFRAPIFLSLTMALSVAFAETPTVTEMYMQSVPNGHAVLPINHYLFSQNRKFFAFLKPNGMLVVYRGEAPKDPNDVKGQALYISPNETDRTNSRNNGPRFFVVQNDGNVVFYEGEIKTGREYFHRNTVLGPGYYFASLDDDNGNLIVYRGKYPDRKGCIMWDLKTAQSGVEGWCDCPAVTHNSGIDFEISSGKYRVKNRHECEDVTCPSGPLSTGGTFYMQCKAQH